MIFVHGFVPDNFGLSITVPVIKDKHGNINSANNYPPITLSPIISKMFEYCMLNRFESLLWSDQLQFGFKKKSSCSRAIFVLTLKLLTISSVKVMCLLPLLMLQRPLIGSIIPSRLLGKLVKLIIDWYGKTFMTVKFNSCYCGTIAVKSGIRWEVYCLQYFFSIFILMN